MKIGILSILVKITPRTENSHPHDWHFQTFNKSVFFSITCHRMYYSHRTRFILTKAFKFIQYEQCFLCVFTMSHISTVEPSLPSKSLQAN